MNRGERFARASANVRRGAFVLLLHEVNLLMALFVCLLFVKSNLVRFILCLSFPFYLLFSSSLKALSMRLGDK